MTPPTSKQIRDYIGTVDLLPTERTNDALLQICGWLLDRIEALENRTDTVEEGVDKARTIRPNIYR